MICMEMYLNGVMFESKMEKEYLEEEITNQIMEGYAQLAREDLIRKELMVRGYELFIKRLTKGINARPPLQTPPYPRQPILDSPNGCGC